jgi:hypothetical protein
MDGFLPSQKMPCIWGDFNACGWAGDGDQSIYAAWIETHLLQSPQLKVCWCLSGQTMRLAQFLAVWQSCDRSRLAPFLVGVPSL